MRQQHAPELNGRGSTGFAALDQGQLREQFILNLRRFAACDLPAANAADRAQAEQQMQAAFATAGQHTQAPGNLNGNLGAHDPDKASLARVQHAWESLVPAWMRFVPLALSTLPAEAAPTELLRLRIHPLKHL